MQNTTLNRPARRTMDRAWATIDALYAAAVEPGQWQQAIEDIRRLLGAESARFRLVDAASGLSDLQVAAPRRSPSDAEAELIGTLAQKLRQEETGRICREYLTDGISSFGSQAGPELLEAVGVRLDSEPSLQLELVLVYTVASGPFIQTQADLLQEILPHLRRAAILTNARRLETGRAAVDRALVNSFELAMLVVNSNSDLVYANRAGHGLLEGQDPLFLFDGRLCVAEARISSRLAHAIHNAISGGRPSGTIAPRRFGSGSVWLFASPLEMSGRNERLCTVVAQDLQRQGAPRAPALRDIFGLTKAEAEVAEYLSDGMRAEDIANLRNVSTATLRTQIRAICEKLDVGRQSEVARRLATLPRLSSFVEAAD